MCNKMRYLGWLVLLLSFSAMAQEPTLATDPAEEDPAGSQETQDGVYLSLKPLSRPVKRLYLTSAALTALSLTGSLSNSLLLEGFGEDPPQNQIYLGATLGATAKITMSTALLTAGLARYRQTGKLRSLGAATVVSAGAALLRFTIFAIPFVAGVEIERNPTGDVYTVAYGVGTLAAIPVATYFLGFTAKEIFQRVKENKAERRLAVEE